MHGSRQKRRPGNRLAVTTVRAIWGIVRACVDVCILTAWREMSAAALLLPACERSYGLKSQNPSGRVAEPFSSCHQDLRCQRLHHSSTTPVLTLDKRIRTETLPVSQAILASGSSSDERLDYFLPVLQIADS